MKDIKTIINFVNMGIAFSTKSSINLFLILIIIGISSCVNNNTSLSFEERADLLIEEMTLEEKVSQLSYTSAAIPRLNIPEYNWWNECLHGVGRAGVSTVFPQAIGMAAMFDDSTMFKVADVVSDEARAKYHHFQRQNKRGIYQGLSFWTPNINIFRDPRWGRGMETYGEDPYLTGKLGVAYINGLQGNDPNYYKLIATAKHFAVHSGPEATRHSFNATPSSYDFKETYSPQFKMAIDEAKVYSVMCAYNRYEGMPCCGNTELSGLLRNDWGFDGYIVSDCWAVRDFYDKDAHEIVNTKAEAAAISLKAGTDLNCGDSYPALVEAVKQGYVTEAQIDISLKRILLARFKLGMFDEDEKVVYSKISTDVIDSEKHQQMALDVAQKSIVLLKNEVQTLPFSKEVKSVAVIGPNANEVDVLLGNYHGYASNPVTPYKGIKAKLPTATVKYASGCQLAEGLPVLTPMSSDVLFTNKDKKSNGLIGSYYNNKTFSGNAEVTKIETNIDFNWWDKAPYTALSADTFSVRFEGVIIPEFTGKYAIGVEGFPTISLTIDEEELISYNSEHHPQKRYEYIQLEKGKSYAIKVDYVQDKTESAIARLLWEKPSTTLKEEAIQLASQSDVVVLCMGLSPLLEGEEMPVKVDGFVQGDRTDISLPKNQTELIKEIQKIGKPTVLVLMNGSALAFNWEADNVPAILEAWYPGQAGGTALANIIFGDCNPSGRLPVTFYKSVTDLPAFDDYNMEGRTYRYFNGEALYPFGYGLSYTSFKYSNLKVPTQVEPCNSIPISVDVTNTGKYNGEEVIQLYVSHPNFSGKKAIRSLKGFKRIALKKGETKNVKFSLQPKDIAILNDDNEYYIDSGAIQISVGGQQANPKALKQQNVLQQKVAIALAEGELYPINKK
ncbi:glycoside hydrolase family 3 C-terminal domain-containing protein [Saccharicrinis aurantiacus]|uniref:glycoside hydrolase family 3 C-terminal domain-containing protein n=1 Tax=Saccharicrinis aurantiacus TaxID=1849719 RepID=UPI0024902901|nr:glycoside hydrolase family 3 C-terminal domain-containing protein [Saccharicrinis aurantiacus]